MNIAKHGMRTAAVGLGGAVRTVSGKSGWVGEREMTEFDFAAGLGAFRDFGIAITDIWFGREDVIQPAHGSCAALKNISDPTEGNHGPDERVKINVECEESPEGNLTTEEFVAAVPMQDQKGDANERLKRGHE